MCGRRCIYVLVMLLAGLGAEAKTPSTESPNVILVMTDDQGYGDFGFTGNPAIRTPNLDAMAEQSARMQHFFVHPVCSPTRASLMTGRYHYRTGVVDTFKGRSLMAPEEVTIAEILKEHDYKTGLFGKWHLGDNYPMRPQDQGFDEVLMHRGGGIGQPSDPLEARGDYRDPVLFRNGEKVARKGYVTDIFFDAVIDFIERVSESDKRFFVYLAPNAPHAPFDQVPKKLYKYYKKQDLSIDRFPDRGHPLPDRINTDRLARIYAMITDIDQNMGRLFETLEALDLKRKTLVLFLTDNGPNGPRYVAGLRGQKTTVYEGGIRSPLFAQWPGVLKPGVASDRIAAHLDLLPTILEACHVPLPKDVEIDGKSIWPLLQRREVDWPKRRFFIQHHRGNEPVLFNNFCARGQRWKLVNATGAGNRVLPGEPDFELYDMRNDPYELHDKSDEHPEIVRRLKEEARAWFSDVKTSNSGNFEPPRIHVGTPHENPTTLTHQDSRFRYNKENEPINEIPFWKIYVAREGDYKVRFRFRPLESSGVAELRVGGYEGRRKLSQGATSCVFPEVHLEKGATTIRQTIQEGSKTRGRGTMGLVDIIRSHR